MLSHYALEATKKKKTCRTAECIWHVLSLIHEPIQRGTGKNLQSGNQVK